MEHGKFRRKPFLRFVGTAERNIPHNPVGLQKRFQGKRTRVYHAFANDSGMDPKRLSQSLGIWESGIWRAIRAMKEVGLLVRDGGDKGGEWIVK